MLRPGQAVEGYVVEDVLGHGGSATVYRARDDAHGTVALKVLDDDHRGPAEIDRGWRGSSNSRSGSAIRTW